MVDDPNEIILDILRTLRSDFADLKAGQNEIKAEIQAIRGHMLAIQTDVSNLYSGQGEMRSRLARVETRLNLTDQQQ